MKFRKQPAHQGRIQGKYNGIYIPKNTAVVQYEVEQYGCHKHLLS